MVICYGLWKNGELFGFTMRSDLGSALNIVLPVKLLMQEESRLCWAAVAQAIANYYRPERKVSQRNLARQIFGESSYNHVYSPEGALKMVGHLNVIVERSLTLGEIAAELNAARPIVACMRYFIGWHLVVVYGLLETRQLLIADPLHGYTKTSFEGFCTSYQGDYSWSHSFLTKHR